MKAIRYKNIDEARRILRELLNDDDAELFSDYGHEPQGLLTVVPEDRLAESDFLRLLEGIQ